MKLQQENTEIEKKKKHNVEKTTAVFYHNKKVFNEMRHWGLSISLNAGISLLKRETLKWSSCTISKLIKKTCPPLENLFRSLTESYVFYSGNTKKAGNSSDDL
ncbi:hypothetical protein CEXT_738041 [Caerostris extrusa]|uniref:Uncharacterized protein n=1 Tax=Caerostris extrusa TaxID=172846 RepID=A0AAV4T9B6_CAEEX|nr:hypothetical protein CEXT_738041 [Caerostris extrusa]